MASIRKELVNDVLKKTLVLTKYNMNIDKQHEFRQQLIRDDASLTNEEKFFASIESLRIYEHSKVYINRGNKRVCKNCEHECLAISYCEYCIRNFLKTKFSEWTSGNDKIDNLIKKCQAVVIQPQRIIEWIPYNNLQHIEYLTKGGCSEIFTAVWINGGYDEWDSIGKQLIRVGSEKVILKRIKNVESANKSWFEEAESQSILSSKSGYFVHSFGLTQDPQNNDYFLVMAVYDIDLRKYLQQNHNQLTWKKRTTILYDIVRSIFELQKENSIHKDLHTGNILYSKNSGNWDISDFGFCGPADKPLGCIYGNLPYIAPEVIIGKGYTFASDIYSIGMIMWEISSGQPPFVDYDHDYNLAMKIVNGKRPKLVSGTPTVYNDLILQCWDADPLKRPDIYTLCKKILEMRKSYYQNKNEEYSINSNIAQLNVQINRNSNSSGSFSKLYNFKDLPEPRNAIEAYDSKQNSLNIPDKITKDYTEQNVSLTNIENQDLKITSNKIKLSNNKGINHTSNKIITDYMQRSYMISDDEEEVYNNSNFHSEDQDDLEIPEELLKD